MEDRDVCPLGVCSLECYSCNLDFLDGMQGDDKESFVFAGECSLWLNYLRLGVVQLCNAQRHWVFVFDKDLDFLEVDLAWLQMCQ